MRRKTMMNEREDLLIEEDGGRTHTRLHFAPSVGGKKSNTDFQAQSE